MAWFGDWNGRWRLNELLSWLDRTWFTKNFVPDDGDVRNGFLWIIDDRWFSRLLDFIFFFSRNVFFFLDFSFFFSENVFFLGFFFFFHEGVFLFLDFFFFFSENNFFLDFFFFFYEGVFLLLDFFFIFSENDFFLGFLGVKRLKSFPPSEQPLPKLKPHEPRRS